MVLGIIKTEFGGSGENAKEVFVHFAIRIITYILL